MMRVTSIMVLGLLVFSGTVGTGYARADDVSEGSEKTAQTVAAMGRNFLANSGFEGWKHGKNKAPDGYVSSGNALFFREIAQVKEGKSSMGLAGTTKDGHTWVDQRIPVGDLAGKTLVFGVWAKSSGCQVSLSILDWADDNHQAATGEAHSADGKWQFLTVRKKIREAATGKIWCRVNHYPQSPEDVVYFDAAIAVMEREADSQKQTVTKPEAVVEQDFVVAWQEDFNGPEVPGTMVKLLRTDDYSKEADQTRLIFSLENGVLTLGGQFEKEVADRGILAWGQGRVGEARISGKGGPWNYDVKEYPILEIKARRAPGLRDPGVCLWAVLKRQDGGGQTGRFWPTLEDDWRVSTFRLAPDSSVPQEMTPRVLMGLNIDPHGYQPVGLEIDWIRVRSFNAKEKAAEEVRIERLTRYRVPRHKLLEEFFPFGPFAAQDQVFYPKGAPMMSCGGFEGNYGLMVRNHMNAFATAHTASYYRYRGHSRTYGPKKEQMQAVEEFIEAMRPRLKAAEATGLRIGADVIGFGPDLEEHGPAFVEPAIKKIVEALSDSPALLGYRIIDEPSAGAEWRVVGVKQIFEENDPEHPTFFAINAGLHGYKIWEPYVALHFPDDYRIHFGNRDPWHVGEMCKAASQFSKRPHWIIPQAMGAIEGPNQYGTYACPTPAEVRLMTYLSLAYGAKGIFYYIWSGPLHKEQVFPVDPYGNPQAEGILAEISRLGEQLVPIGHLLLPARWREPSELFEVKANQASERGLTLGLLEDKGLGVRYLGVVNNDLEQELDGVVTILPKPANDGKQVYNLHSFDVVGSAGATEFSVAKLAPGDGRFYVQATAEDFEKVRTALLIQQAKEVLRIMTPDLRIAERWELDMTGVRKLQADAEARMAAGDGEAALLLAQQASQALKELMAADETLPECRKRLDAIRKKMGVMNVHMPWRNEPWHEEPWRKNPRIVELLNPYWAARAKYNELETRFIAGESDGLLDAVKAQEEYVNKLAHDVLAAVGKAPAE